MKRGDGQTIEAVIWYCDLRGFTRLSDTLPRDTIIALLNDYFDTMGDIVTNAGGEILKFMGDGMLAIFPVPTPADRAATASTAGPRRRVGRRCDAGAEPHPRHRATSRRCASAWRCILAR